MADRNGTADERIIQREAAEWFAVLHDEQASEEQRRRWRAWIDADPAHARIWERVKAISQPFAQAADAAPAQALRETLAKAQSAGRRRALRVLGLGGVAVGAGLLARLTLPWQGWLHEYAVARADYRTDIGEQRRLTLPDGTRLDLNTATAVDVDFGRSLRRIVLHAGEILVDSAPDTQAPARALVVDTPCARLTALGTRFAVRGDARNEAFSGHVAVFAGAVRISLANGAQLDVPAGRQARFTSDSIEPDGRADLARESWSRGQLVADDIPLAAFVAELSRYTPVSVTVSPQAAPLRLVGAYPIAQPSRDIPVILAALESALPVRVERTPAGDVHIRAR
ncbi:FecR domain-containing protein [Ottowia testudinis]|uniref:FecR domain-containing protein n=1 Tax=Ottowia testudinis TaxID=2816950 RepID=A0A975H1Z8_9BURK|nr:FecR domain-containing protein [Ottowia testudinis]QTD43635.1 FecR domain-containing protein [Ottowia testudinis]